MTSLTPEIRYQWDYPVLKRKVGRPRISLMTRKEYRKRWYQMKAYGNLDRLKPDFVKPKQKRKKRSI
jgi:hypothetical protein